MASNKPVKTMSSRLSTMKFMQRASASPSSAPNSPSEPPSKRQRLSRGSVNATPNSTSDSDAQKSGDALDRTVADRDDTNWVLSLRESQQPMEEVPLRVVSVGYSTLDTTSGAPPQGEVDNLTGRGRRNFGKFKRTVTTQQNPGTAPEHADHDDENISDVDGDESDDPTGATAMIAEARREAGDKARQTRHAKRKTEATDSQRMADERRQKQFKLNGADKMPNGISSGGRNMDSTCHRCGKPGHKIRDCPQTSREAFKDR